MEYCHIDNSQRAWAALPYARLLQKCEPRSQEKSLTKSTASRHTPRTHVIGLVFPLLLLLCFCGCAARVGPKSLAHDRFDYSAAITQSWKEQMLLNMVKLRYMDPPCF